MELVTVIFTGNFGYFVGCGGVHREGEEST